MDVDQCIEAWPRSEDPRLALALHAVFHFRADKDIRRKDADYNAWQTDQLADPNSTGRPDIARGLERT